MCNDRRDFLRNFAKNATFTPRASPGPHKCFLEFTKNAGSRTRFCDFGQEAPGGQNLPLAAPVLPTDARVSPVYPVAALVYPVAAPGDLVHTAVVYRFVHVLEDGWDGVAGHVDLDEVVLDPFVH